MTFKEYVKQSSYLCSGVVRLTEEDCFHIYKVPKGRVIDLVVLGQHYSYFIQDGERILWTMDCDGNRKAMSVFSIHTA